jgi:hypothetical protein
MGSDISLQMLNSVFSIQYENQNYHAAGDLIESFSSRVACSRYNIPSNMFQTKNVKFMYGSNSICGVFCCRFTDVSCTCAYIKEGTYTIL